MSATLEIDQLRVGIFVHLDLGWWAHPFALSSFAIASQDQIETLRGLGLKKVRWSADKSLPIASAPQTAQAREPEIGTRVVTAAAANDPASRHRSAVAAQRAADRLCAKQYGEAGRAWTAATDMVRSQPQQAREASVGLTRSLLSKMMIDDDMCVRVLSDGLGDQDSAHALNVTVISLLLGRVFGLTASEMLDMGVGALMHDVGKLDIPERAHFPDDHFTPAEHLLYRDHVAHGVAQAKRMGLSPGALLVLAQHHEMADGGGFPLRLNADRMPTAARIVSLVNAFDNLCNPMTLTHALTPHEALSIIFAQMKNKFDASLLNAFIRMMGVYPPGSYVQLTDERYAAVLSVNSSRPLRPRVLVCDPNVPIDQALPLNLEHQPNLGVRRSLKPVQLPAEVRSYLSPRQRIVYFFEPAAARDTEAEAEAEAEVAV